MVASSPKLISDRALHDAELILVHGRKMLANQRRHGHKNRACRSGVTNIGNIRALTCLCKRM